MEWEGRSHNKGPWQAAGIQLNPASIQTTRRWHPKQKGAAESGKEWTQLCA